MIVGNIRTFNKVKIGVLFLSLSLILTACETEEEAAEGHLQKGVELLKQGDYAAAQLELKSAKQGNKSTAETYYYLALLDEKSKHFLAMEDNLQKTLKLEPEHDQARLKLGKLQLLMGKTDKANENADRLLAKDPQETEVLILKASVLFKLARQDEAMVMINQVLELSPENVDALTIKALMLMQLKQQDEALVLINRALSQDEKKVTLHFLKIRIHGGENDLDAVIDDYLTLIRLFPKNDNYKITLAKIYTKSGKLEAAEELLRNLVAERPRQIKPKILLLEFLSATASEKVEPQLQAFTKELAGQPGQLLEFSKWMLAKGNTSGAETMLSQIVASKGNSEVGIQANILLAKLAFDKQDYAKTDKIVTGILKQVPDQLEAKLLKVRLLLVDEKYVEAKAFLDKVIWSHPKSDEAVVLLAQFYLVQGDRHAARTEFKAALELNPANIQAFTPIYDDLMAKQDYKYARQLLGKALRKKPQQALLLQKLIQINMLEEEWSEATKAAAALQRLPKHKKLARFYFANILQGQGQCEKAIVIYQELIDEFPEQLRVLQNMSGCYELLNKRSEMISLLKESIQNNQQSIASVLVLSDLYIANKQNSKANKLLTDLVSRKPKLSQARQRLAKNYIATGDIDKAIEVYQQGLEIFPGNVRLSLALATLYEQKKAYDKAVETYEQLLITTPGLLVANNNLATLLVDHFPTAENLQRAKELVQPLAASEQVYYQDTYAWTLLHLGNVNDALGIFKKLIVKSPNVPVFRYHLGVAEYKRGNNSKALVQIDQAIELSKQGYVFSERKEAERLKKEIIAKIRGH